MSWLLAMAYGLCMLSMAPAAVHLKIESSSFTDICTVDGCQHGSSVLHWKVVVLYDPAALEHACLASIL